MAPFEIILLLVIIAVVARLVSGRTHAARGLGALAALLLVVGAALFIVRA
jgi:hypothetical protein